MITALQCKMARTALDLGVRDLAELADVSPNTVSRLERGERMHSRTLAYMRGVLEAAGAVFVARDEVSAWGGEGVRHHQVANPTSRMARLFLAFRSLPNMHREPRAAYDALLDVFEQIVEIIRLEGREPDTWERHDLNVAASALNRSDVFSAAHCLWLAITPPDNQSKEYPISSETAAEVEECDLAYFVAGVQALRARGYVERWS